MIGYLNLKEDKAGGIDLSGKDLDRYVLHPIGSYALSIQIWVSCENEYKIYSYDYEEGDLTAATTSYTMLTFF